MHDIIEFISQPWHWAISGLLIALLMFSMLISGERLGVSSSFETACSMSGLGKWIEHFDYDWKTQKWVLMFIMGLILGGYISSAFLQSSEPLQLSQATITTLTDMGVSVPADNLRTHGIVPEEIFNFKSLFTLRGFILMVIGGFLIGFGTRYAAGCTSGHAISGLANLQLASLIAVVGFFIGGIFSTFFLMPIILGL